VCKRKATPSGELQAWPRVRFRLDSGFSFPRKSFEVKVLSHVLSEVPVREDAEGGV